MKVYVHIPFCASKCYYCDFYSTPRREWADRFVNALRNEWRQRTPILTEDIDTLYFGGGTPSSLTPEQIKDIINIFPLNENLREATIEVNPEDVDSSLVEFIVKETPFRRVSMGVQSFCDDELRAVGRRHYASKAVEVFKIMRAGGIDNISCDLIYGLPGQTIESWQQSLDTLLALSPEHISAYLLSFEEGTRLSAMLSVGKIREADEETVTKMYEILCDKTSRAGYEHYEISNFALPGRNAIHNSAYWDGSPYIGLGPGAHSWDGSERSYNPSSLKDYLACEGRDFTIIDPENELNRYNDLLITRLRTRKGLHPAEIDTKFGHASAEDFSKEAERLLNNNQLARTDEGAYVIPESLWLQSNSILLQLIKI